MDDLTGLPLKAALMVAGVATLFTIVLTLWGVTGGSLAEQVAYDIILFLAIVLGYNLFTGTTGYVSFGHGLFYALGGYAAILLAGWLGGLASIPLAGLVNALLAVLVFGPLLRARGPYFSIASLALFLAVAGIVSVVPGLGGSEGLTAPRGAGLGGDTALLAAEAITLTAIAASLLVGTTVTGKRIIAIRDNEEAARALGVNPLPYRLAMLAISGFIVGAAGAIFFLSYGGRGYIDPVLAFDPHTNLLMVLAAVAGGIGTLSGVVIGSILVKVLDNILAMYSPALVSLLGAGQSEAPLLVTTLTYLTLGMLVAALALGAPRGIYGLLETTLYPRIARLTSLGRVFEVRRREGSRG